MNDVLKVKAFKGYLKFFTSLKGKVYAVEIQDELIGYLKNKKDLLKDTIVSIDLALLVDVYHELEYSHETLQAKNKALKPDGKILLIEYRGEDPTVPIKSAA